MSVAGEKRNLTGLQLTNGTFQMRVIDVLQPSTLVIEATTNLAYPAWSPVETNTLTGNTFTVGSSCFSDPQWTNYPARFYRLRSP